MFRLRATKPAPRGFRLFVAPKPTAGGFRLARDVTNPATLGALNPGKLHSRV